MPKTLTEMQALDVLRSCAGAASCPLWEISPGERKRMARAWLPRARARAAQIDEAARVLGLEQRPAGAADEDTVRGRTVAQDLNPEP